MALEPKDYLSIAAVVLSLASFLLALRNARYTHRAKGAELRAQVLIKYSDARITAARLKAHLEDTQKRAESVGDLELFKIANFVTDLEEIISSLDDSRREIEEMDSSDGLKLFEAMFHRVTETSNRIAGIRERTEKKITEHETRRERKPRKA